MIKHCDTINQRKVTKISPLNLKYIYFYLNNFKNYDYLTSFSLILNQLKKTNLFY